MPDQTPRPSAPLLPFFAALFVAVTLVAALPADAQPFGSWAIFDSDARNSYYEIPHSAALNPTGSMTIEGWVAVDSTPGCSSLIGKDWQTAWWIGSCNNVLRSYIRGSTSVRDAGRLDGPGGWHHFAVTWDGNQRCHYVDGVQEGCWVESPGPLPSNTRPLRIGSDVSWTPTPDGSINEMRLWNVARTTEQIRETINVPITDPMPGLVAVWAQGGPEDVVGPHDGVERGTVPRLGFPAALSCGGLTPTSLCLHDRFIVSGYWRTDSDEGQAQTVNLFATQSGIFWFFNPTNWEVMVKVLNGCPINGHWWAFSAATTNVFYRLEVLDVQGGPQKIYFNYPGPPAPAVTDVEALAACS